MKKLTSCRMLYALFLLGALALFVGQLRSDNWLQTDLQTLLPESQTSALQQHADQQQDAQLNRQIIALIGHPEPQRAFELTQKTAEMWQTSGLFSTIFYQTTPDITKLQSDIATLAFATLPNAVQTQLLNSPADYFQQYAEQIVNPFQRQNLLSLEQDWLGFGRFAFDQASLQNKLSWNAENGMLSRTLNDITWVMLQGELAQGNLINPNTSLLDLTEQSRKQLSAENGQLLLAGSALFAAHAKQQAEQESTLMSIAGVSLTLLLLFAVFRTPRVLWLFLPIGVGMLSGIVATVLAFGQIHILTLLIGTSLIGVLIDFPLHWLSGSRFHSDWQPQPAMEKLRFTFLISLFVTLLGYLLLGFTPLKVLQQTALFSAVALVVALLATVWFLPPLFRKYHSRGGFCTRPLLGKWRAGTRPAPTKWIIGYVVLVGFMLFGISKTHWQDDIRQWVALPEPLVKQAQQIAEMAGEELGGQYFLVVAENDENLLNREKTLTEQLLLLQEQGKISSFNGLSQWIMSPSAQEELAEQLKQRIQASDYAILTEIGLEPTVVEQALLRLREQPPVALQTALNSEIGRAWRPFYLGEIEPGKVASIVKLHGLQNLAEIRPLANGTDIFWQDKRIELNHAFEQSRNQAAWLKLLSFVIAGLLLWRLFGLLNAGKMLLVPLGAIAATLAIFGWLGIPISLFAMFGLLLVSALGIDYTAYMQTAPEPLAAKQRAIVLAASTTLISFTLLSFSSTPAVAAFGLSVSLGVIFSVLITLKIFK